MKYDFALDMDTDNSNSLILREIKPNSTVLEFGPAHGRMTKYLKEELNCGVVIVEKDAVAGKQADNYSKLSFLGDDLGDIEKYLWAPEIGGLKFDYIIFADVLEHLYDPLKALCSIKYMLNTKGTVLISVPNIAHNSVIIDLLNNKFEYREIGLLDNTHIRFFTESSLLELVEKTGLRVQKRINTYNEVENTEFNNSFNDVPPEIAQYLRNRKNGDLYQFVWILSL